MIKKLILPVLLLVGLFGQAQTVSKSYEKEIKNLLKKKDLASVFEYLVETDPTTITDLIKLTEIPAPPFKEEVRARAFAEMLNPFVDSVWTDSEGNVLALRKGTQRDRRVVLDAHLDTVFPEGTDVKVKYLGDTLKAPGIGDDTRGLSMVIAIARAMKEKGIQTEADVLFVGSVGEEGLGDLRGVKYILQEAKMDISSWISIDGGAIGRINNQGLGSVRYRATFRGPGGHSWGAFGLANPHHAMSFAVSNYTLSATEYTSEGPKTSFNIGVAGGGTSVNSIPFESWVEVDMRSVEPDRLKEIDAIFKESMMEGLEKYNQTVKSGPKITLELEMIGMRPSGDLSPDLPLIQRAMAATEAMGYRSRLTEGSTNANTPISLGIPAITIGRGGRGGNAHSLDEWWVNDNGVEAIKLAMLILVAEAGYSK